MSKAKEMYKYLTTKHGLSRNKALGMLANAQGESGFNSAAVGDGGASWGLFQWNHGAGRRDPMVAAVGKDWRTNWKGQLDHAVDTAMNGYGMKNRTFKSAEEAAHWFMINYEKPAKSVRPARDRKHNKFIQQVGLQEGGVANVSGMPSNITQKAMEATERFAGQIAEASTGPTIIIDEGQGPTIAPDGNLHMIPPELPAGSEVPAAVNYMFYDLSYGPVY